MLIGEHLYPLEEVKDWDHEIYHDYDEDTEQKWKFYVKVTASGVFTSYFPRYFDTVQESSFWIALEKDFRLSTTFLQFLFNLVDRLQTLELFLKVIGISFSNGAPGQQTCTLMKFDKAALGLVPAALTSIEGAPLGGLYCLSVATDLALFFGSIVNQISIRIQAENVSVSFKILLILMKIHFLWVITSQLLLIFFIWIVMWVVHFSLEAFIKNWVHNRINLILVCLYLGIDWRKANCIHLMLFFPFRLVIEVLVFTVCDYLWQFYAPLSFWFLDCFLLQNWFYRSVQLWSIFQIPLVMVIDFNL